MYVNLFPAFWKYFVGNIELDDRHKGKQDRSHPWSTRPAHSPGPAVIFAFNLKNWDVRTTYVKIVVTTGQDGSLPCGSLAWIYVHHHLA